MAKSTFTHPEYGRVYEAEDPAHRFAVLLAALARQADQFAFHYRTMLRDRDYLAQAHVWNSDPSRIAHVMAHTIAALDKAYTDMVVDRESHRYGLGTRDLEWERKYGDPGETTDDVSRRDHA